VEPIFAEQVKDYITKYQPIISIPRTIEQVLIDMNPSVGQVLDLIDNDKDGKADDPGGVVTRICGGLYYNIEGYANHQYITEDAPDWVWGVINPYGVGFSLSTPQGGDIASKDGYFLIVDCGYGQFEFQLDSSINLGDCTEANPGPLTASFADANAAAGNFGVIAYSASGSVTFKSCRIIERAPLFNTPSYVEVKGSFSGVMNSMTGFPDGTVTFDNPAFDGAFNLVFLTFNLTGDPNGPVVNYLESNCEGGLKK
jgi:hypothetical protein